MIEYHTGPKIEIWEKLKIWSRVNTFLKEGRSSRSKKIVSSEEGNRNLFSPNPNISNLTPFDTPLNYPIENIHHKNEKKQS